MDANDDQRAATLAVVVLLALGFVVVWAFWPRNPEEFGSLVPPVNDREMEMR